MVVRGSRMAIPKSGRSWQYPDKGCLANSQLRPHQVLWRKGCIEPHSQVFPGKSMCYPLNDSTGLVEQFQDTQGEVQPQKFHENLIDYYDARYSGKDTDPPFVAT